MKLERTDGIPNGDLPPGFRSLAEEIYEGDLLWSPKSESAIDDCLELAASGATSIEAVVAREQDRTLARAMAILPAPAESQDSEGWIGLFECLPDSLEAGVAVLQHCCRWLAARGAQRVQAPRTDRLRAGLQIGGFDQPQTIYTAHNPGFYADIFSAAGFTLATRMVSVLFTKRRAPSFLGLGRRNYSIRSVDTTKLDAEIARIERFQSEMFEGHIGHVSQSTEEARQMMRRLLPGLDPDLVILATDQSDQTIGVLICLPDMWQDRESVDRARLISIGVAPEWRGQRVAMSMGAQLAETLIDKGYLTLEGSWVLEDNRRPQVLAKLLGARPGREFALFNMDLRLPAA